MDDGIQVGELAERTGLTVRTLHHYDELGLLTPADRTEAGYRLYSRDDVERLLRILALRQLGLSLSEVGEALADAPETLSDLLDRHREALRRQVHEQKRLLRRLDALGERIRASAEEVSVDALIETMETITMFEKHFTDEQLATLEERGKELGPETIAAVEAEWPTLIEKVRAAMEAGTDPGDPDVQALADRWQELVEMFTGGDEGIARGVAEVYREEPEARERTGLDPEVMAYVRQALDART